MELLFFKFDKKVEPVSSIAPVIFKNLNGQYDFYVSSEKEKPIIRKKYGKIEDRSILVSDLVKGAERIVRRDGILMV